MKKKYYCVLYKMIDFIFILFYIRMYENLILINNLK